MKKPRPGLFSWIISVSTFPEEACILPACPDLLLPFFES